MVKFSELDLKSQVEMVNKWSLNVEQISDELWQDKDFVKFLILSNSTAYGKESNRTILKLISENMPEQYKSEEFIFSLSEEDARVTYLSGIAEIIPEKLRNSGDFLIKAALRFGDVESVAPTALKRDPYFHEEIQKSYKRQEKIKDMNELEKAVRRDIERIDRHGMSREECENLFSPNNHEYSFYSKINYREELILRAPRAIIERAMKYGVLKLSELTPAYKNDEVMVEIAISQDFENINEASDRIKDSQEFSQYVEMADAIKQYRENDSMKLKDLKSEYFTNPLLYNKVVDIVKNRMQTKFIEATQGVELNEELNEELQAKFEKQLSKVQSELERRKKFAMLKAGIKDKVDKLLHRDEASKVMKEISNFEV